MSIKFSADWQHHLPTFCVIIVFESYLNYYFGTVSQVTKLGKIDRLAAIEKKMIKKEMSSLAFEQVVVIYTHQRMINTVGSTDYRCDLCDFSKFLVLLQIHSIYVMLE